MVLRGNSDRGYSNFLSHVQVVHLAELAALLINSGVDHERQKANYDLFSFIRKQFTPTVGFHLLFEGCNRSQCMRIKII